MCAHIFFPTPPYIEFPFTRLFPYFHLGNVNTLRDVIFSLSLPPLFDAADRLAGDPAGPDPPGQLPDVRVSSVHVREKAVQGRASVIILMLYLCMGICVCFSANSEKSRHGWPPGSRRPHASSAAARRPQQAAAAAKVQRGGHAKGGPAQAEGNQGGGQEEGQGQGKQGQGGGGEGRKGHKRRQRKEEYLHLRGKSVKAVKY